MECWKSTKEVPDSEAVTKTPNLNTIGHLQTGQGGRAWEKREKAGFVWENQIHLFLCCNHLAGNGIHCLAEGQFNNSI